MARKSPGEGSFERTVFDAIPSPVFVADYDLRIVDANEAAHQTYGEDAALELRRLCGDVLQCVRPKESGQDCGTTEHCPNCVVRNTAIAAMEQGKATRQKSEMVLLRGGQTVRLIYLVTASAFKHDGESLILLILEDVTELMELRGILPICAHCKKVRTDEQFWEQVDSYFGRHTDVTFSHGVCPECIAKFFPDAGKLQSDP